jgi:DNA-directed RNA polymerase subunit RPC12/RpoP
MDMLPRGYDSWRLSEPPEPEVLDYCAECGAEIFRGDEVLSVDDGLICKECFLEYAKRVLKPTVVVAEPSLFCEI